MQILFSIFIDISNFSFFDSSALENFFFTFTQTMPFSENFQAMDIFLNIFLFLLLLTYNVARYRSMNSIDNLGLMFFYMLLMATLYLLFFLFIILLKALKVSESNL